MDSFAAKTASQTCFGAEDETLPKEQTRFRSKANRSQKYAGDPTYTRAASSSDRNRSVRADFSSKTLWAPPCNRQPSNIIIIVCNIYFLLSNDRSPANPAVDKQAFRNRIPSRPISRDHAAALIQLSITQQKSTRIFFSAIPLSPRLVLILLQQPP